MAKTRQQKIESIDVEMAQLLAEKEKLLAQQHEIDEKARLSRYKKRMELFEKLLPDTIELTEGKFKTLLEIILLSDDTRMALEELKAEDTAATVPAEAPKTAAQTNPPADNPAEKTAQNTHTSTPQGVPSAGRDNPNHTPKPHQQLQLGGEGKGGENGNNTGRGG
jgi:hypothetical protein